MKQLILKLTHRMWNREISRILCRSYEQRLITSQQLHLLTSKFDPTQQHEVYKTFKPRIGVSNLLGD